MKPFASLKVALISDELTSHCIGLECRVAHLTPYNYPVVLGLWRPDLVFVESAWNGWRNRWKFRIAAYPDHPSRNNNALRRVVEAARRRNIPTVFWNK